MTLAYCGGRPIITPIAARDTVSNETRGSLAAYTSNQRGWNTSGYLAGSQRGGMAIQKLETVWCQTFSCPHAIAINSATSAILAAVRVLSPPTVHIPVMGMSAIAAIPAILGCDIHFYDVDEHYCINPPRRINSGDLILAVNLFGHPAQLRTLRELADKHDAWLVEDNAQGLMAKENGVYAGTIGHIGIWSGNVHKPLNCGELGIMSAYEPALADELRSFMNHGEVAGGKPGMNLRPTEETAVMALAQLPTALDVVSHCQDICLALWDTTFDDNVLHISLERDGCESACYCLPIIAPSKEARDFAVTALQAEGLPCRAGYVRIDKMPAFAAYTPDTEGLFPYADEAQNHMILVELCAIDPTDEQIEQISEALNAIGKEIEDDRKVRRRTVRQSRRQARELSAADTRGKKAKG